MRLIVIVEVLALICFIWGFRGGGSSLTPFLREEEREEDMFWNTDDEMPEHEDHEMHEGGEGCCAPEAHDEHATPMADAIMEAVKRMQAFKGAHLKQPIPMSEACLEVAKILISAGLKKAGEGD